MEKYLKEIANELKLIRKELQMENVHMDEPQRVEVYEEEVRPDIAMQLNHMFNKDQS